MPKATKHAGDALRDVPPREFVRARDALAARLAEEGKGTEAREIRPPPPPSPVVWALNLAAVTERQLRADLMAGGLTGEQRGPGFAVLSQGPIPAEFLRDRPAPPRSAPVREAKVVRAAPAQTDRAGASRPARPGEADARRRAQQAGRAARQAQQAARALGRDAHQKERAAQAAEKELATLRKTLEKREQQSAVLRAAADQAREARGRGGLQIGAALPGGGPAGGPNFSWGGRHGGGPRQALSWVGAGKNACRYGKLWMSETAERRTTTADEFSDRRVLGTSETR